MDDRPSITSLEDAQASVGPGHAVADVEAAWKAAEAYVGKRVRWGEPDPEGNWPSAPADLVQAVQMLTRRYLARKSSPDGFIGLGEFGPARVPTMDRDVQLLIAPYVRVVVA